MKYLKSIGSKSTVILLAVSAMFIFSGCNAENGTAPSTSVTNNQNNNGNSVVNSANSNQSTQTSQDNDDQSMQTHSMVTDAQRQEYLDAINAARAETQDCGSEGVFDPAPALTWSNQLDNAAYEHSYDMAESDTFSHDGSGTDTDITALEKHLDRGSKFYERIKYHGYTQYRSVGENIAAGYKTAQEVVEAWLASDHHCANLMNPIYKEVGMVMVQKNSSEYGFYWSQEFGAKN